MHRWLNQAILEWNLLYEFFFFFERETNRTPQCSRWLVQDQGAQPKDSNSIQISPQWWQESDYFQHHRLFGSALQEAELKNRK